MSEKKDLWQILMSRSGVPAAPEDGRTPLKTATGRAQDSGEGSAALDPIYLIGVQNRSWAPEVNRSANSTSLSP